jgi:hypothetical protein
MKPLELNLPMNIEVEVIGQMYEAEDPTELLQDILEIHLSNGVCIDVGWHPECDPNGSYRIVVFRDYWPTQLREPICIKDPSEVREEIKRLVSEYSQNAVALSCSGKSEDRTSFPTTAHGPLFDARLAAA